MVAYDAVTVRALLDGSTGPSWAAGRRCERGRVLALFLSAVRCPLPRSPCRSGGGSASCPCACGTDLRRHRGFLPLPRCALHLAPWWR